MRPGGRISDPHPIRSLNRSDDVGGDKPEGNFQEDCLYADKRCPFPDDRLSPFILSTSIMTFSEYLPNRRKLLRHFSPPSVGTKSAI